MPRMIVSLLAALILNCCCTVLVGRADDRSQKFKNLDGNQDGVLSGTEMRGLDSLDKNRDGTITLEEYQQDSAKRLTEAEIELQWNRRDSNVDGWLSGTEVKGIESYDSNRDGLVTLEEFRIGVSAMPSPNSPLVVELDRHSQYRVVSQADAAFTWVKLNGEKVEQSLPRGELLKVIRNEDPWLWVERTGDDFHINNGWVLKDSVTDFERGADMLESMRLSKPSDVATLKLIVRLADKDGRFDVAIKMLDDAIAQSPEDVPLHALRSLIWDKMNYASKAFADIMEALQRERSSVNHLVRGVLWMHQGDYEKATHDFDIAIQQDSELASAYDYRGIIEFSQGKTNQALIDFSRAIELNPFHAPYYCDRAELWLSQHKHDFAMEDLNASFQLDPNYGTANLIRSFVWQAMGNEPSAAADVELAYAHATTNSERAEIHMRLGQAYQEAGQIEKAISRFRAAGEETQEPMGYLALALLEMQSDPNAAVQDAKKAVALLHDEGGFDVLGLAHLASGDSDRASDAFDKAISLATSELRRQQLRELARSKDLLANSAPQP